MFITSGSGLLGPNRDMLSIGITTKHNHKVCPALRNSGNVMNWHITWVKVMNIKDETQNCMAFKRQRLKWRDSKMRWKIETSSSMLNDNDDATEISICDKLVGDGDGLVGFWKTGTCWQTWGYSGSMHIDASACKKTVRKIWFGNSSFKTTENEMAFTYREYCWNLLLNPWRTLLRHNLA